MINGIPTENLQYDLYKGV